MGSTWTKFLNFGLCKDGQKLEITSAVVIVTSELSCFDTAVICDWLQNFVSSKANQKLTRKRT